MILYLDTSALVKLYVQEPGADTVRNRVAAATLSTTHDLSYVEAHSAFARKWRDGSWSERSYRRTIAALDDDWAALHRVGVTQMLVRRAAAFPERFGLRAYDAVHLAAAEAIQEQLGRTAAVEFCCFDQRLTSAAADLGLQAVRG